MTVKQPWALVRNVELPLYVAEDLIADQVTSPADERLTPAGRLRVDGAGRGSTTITVADSAAYGLLGVVVQLPNGRLVATSSFWNPPRRD